MKLYKTRSGILIESKEGIFEADIQNWDSFINDDQLLDKLNTLVASGKAIKAHSLDESQIVKPVGNQELWACGVTYLRSKVGRQEESKLSGGADFYAKVYEAARPEVFFKATAHRIVGRYALSAPIRANRGRAAAGGTGRAASVVGLRPTGDRLPIERDRRPRDDRLAESSRALAGGLARVERG